MNLRLPLAVLGLILSASLSAQPLNNLSTELFKTDPTPLAFTSLNSEKSYTSGSWQTIHWNGGAPTERLRLEVYEEDSLFPERVQIIDSSFVNANELTFRLSKKLKSGHNYYFLLTNETGEAVKSEGFSLKKIPLWVKIAVPVVVVTGVILVISSKSSNSTEDTGIADPLRPK